MDELFETIIWYIQDKPVLHHVQIKQYNRDGYTFRPRNITPEEMDTVLFKNDIHITFPLTDDLAILESSLLSGPITVKSLFNAIWNYYQQPLNPTYYSEVFEKNPDLEEEVLMKYDDDKTQVINLDTFSNYPCAPDFVGLSLLENGSYIVDLGPV
jgi:hypothetical protein